MHTLSSPSSANRDNSYSSTSLQSKTKARITYYPSQVKTLEKAFDEHPYPNKNTVIKLSQELEIPETKIKVKHLQFHVRININTI